MSFRTACANKYEREQMKYEPHPEEWLRRHRQIVRERIMEFVSGAVLVAMIVGGFTLWLVAEGVVR